VLIVLPRKDHGEQARPGAPTRDHVKWRRRLRDRFARPARPPLAHGLLHEEFARHDFERLGDVLAEFGQFLTAAARAGFRRFHNGALARQMLWQRPAFRLAAGVGGDIGNRILSACFRVGARGVFGDIALDVFQRQLHLLGEAGAALGLLAELRAPQAQDFQSHVEQQGFGGFLARATSHDQRLQRFDIVGQIGGVHGFE
jgi:hypothetical protein